MTRLTTQEPGAISIRAKGRQQGLIDLAAERQGRSRLDFMPAASCQEPKDVLLDQTFFAVTAETFKKFKNLVTNPLPSTNKLRRLLKKKAPWDI